MRGDFPLLFRKDASRLEGLYACQLNANNQSSCTVVTVVLPHEKFSATMTSTFVDSRVTNPVLATCHA